MRKVYLNEAMRKAIDRLEIAIIDKQLAEYVDAEPLKRVALFGVRGELIFPVPCILEAEPFLLGYYRLLFGLSQKEFYKNPFSRFKHLEESGQLSYRVKDDLPRLCKSLIGTAQLLVRDLDQISSHTIHELQLLTLGPQLRGSRNTALGDRAEREVFAIVSDILSESPESQVEIREKSFRVVTKSGKRILFQFAGDPDLSVVLQGENGDGNLLSVEIKGGTDASNIHNRLGEAEKSHLKAKAAGFSESWTIIAVGLDFATARQRSPSTDKFFYLEKLKDTSTDMYRMFREALLSKIND
jgi:hypothetical protein